MSNYDSAEAYGYNPAESCGVLLEAIVARYDHRQQSGLDLASIRRVSAAAIARGDLVVPRPLTQGEQCSILNRKARVVWTPEARKLNGRRCLKGKFNL